VKRPRVLALVLAGGEGGRMAPLTNERAKPALPFGGTYRLIDFPLSNCAHSGIRDVWVIQQYEPHDLTKQLANGRPWDLDRTSGGLLILHPYLGDSESGWYEGNADALFRNREAIAKHDPDVLLVLSADHVYKLDYRDVIDGHVRSDAAVTMVTSKVPREEADRYGVVEADGEGRVTGFEYKPAEPRSGLVTTEVFVYDARVLRGALDELAEDGEGSGLKDFGHELLPRLVENGTARAFELETYWRDVGTIESYWQAHMELLAQKPALALDDPAWPVLTAGLQRPPARFERPARLEASLVAAGAVVRGEVERSVIGPGVVIDEGATVRDSILFHDCHVASGATIARSIVDERVRVESGAEVGGVEEIAVVGAGEIVAMR
jgi:glucose-1-phosphate adenylyltransferase